MNANTNKCFNICKLYPVERVKDHINAQDLLSSLNRTMLHILLIICKLHFGIFYLFMILVIFSDRLLTQQRVLRTFIKSSCL